MLPTYGPLADHFYVDRDRVFLNHGSFGNTPRAILDLQHLLQRQVERDPIQWFVTDGEPILRAARLRIAHFIDAEPDSVMLIHNATAGVSTVVRALLEPDASTAGLGPADELLTTTHEYNACNNALRFAAEVSGAKLVMLPLPCPMVSDDQIVSAIVGAITASTRLLLLSHITSASGLILPALRIVREARARASALGNDRLSILVDGAHSAGYVDFSVRECFAAGADWYTGNLHKWTCGPKGTAFLAVAPHKQASTAPLIISHGYNGQTPGLSRFRQMANFYGSMDYTNWAVIPQTLDLLASWHAEGLVGLRREQSALRARGVEMLRATLRPLGGGETLGPEHTLGAMAAITLPPHPKPPAPDPTKPFDPIYDHLLGTWKIQVPAYSLHLTDGTKQRVIRFSAGIYNSEAQMEYLAEAVAAEIQRERA